MRRGARKAPSLRPCRKFLPLLLSALVCAGGSCLLAFGVQPARGQTEASQPATRTSPAGGVYDVFPESNPNHLDSKFVLRPLNYGFRVEDVDHIWSGTGAVIANKGYFLWRFRSGQSGRTDFVVNQDGSWAGRSVGTGVDYPFIVRSAANQPGSGTNQAASIADRDLSFCVDGSKQRQASSESLQAEIVASCTRAIDILRRRPNGLPADAWVVFLSRANAYEGSSNIEFAVQDYSEALRLNPSSIEARLMRGAAYMVPVPPSPDKAIADTSEVIRLMKSTGGPSTDLDTVWLAGAYSVRGSAYSSKKQYGEAIKNFETALHYFPGMGGVAEQMAEAREGLRRTTGQGVVPAAQTGGAGRQVFRCDGQSEAGPVVQMLTIDFAIPSVRLTNTAVGLTEEFVDGRDGVALVAKSTPAVGNVFTQEMAIQMAGLDQPVRQFVIVNGNQVQFGAREWSSTPTLDLETGLFSGGMGSDSVCRRIK